MKSAIFDSGTIISLTINNLLWILSPLKKKFGGEFYITESVKRELIDVPLETKKYKFEGFQVLSFVEDGLLKVIKSDVLKQDTIRILEIANNIYKAKGEWIRPVHYADMSCIAACLNLNSSVLFIDERTTRLLVENPRALRKLYKSKLHTDISISKENMKKFEKLTRNIKILRSTELVAMAFELGIMDEYLPKTTAQLKNPKRDLLSALLWAVKLNGCAISEKEMDRIIRIENL